MIFDLVTWLNQATFIAFFTIVNASILIHFLKKLRDILKPDMEGRRTGYALVTGCDSGFGYATVLALSKENIYTFAGCLTIDGVQNLRDDPKFKGMALLMDVTKKEEVDNVKKIIENNIENDGLCCLINNAGICLPGPIEWMSVHDMKKSMNVNLWGTVNVTKTMLPLVKKCCGRIVNMSSISGRVSDSNFSAYAMTKYALEAFSDSLRHEMRPWGVSVHIIEPGHYATNLFSGFEKRWKDLWAIQPKEIQLEYGEEYHKEVLCATERTMSAFKSNNQDVVDAYLHAALSSRPKLRYVVGVDAKTAGILVATVPTAVADFIRSLIFPTVVPAVCKDNN